MSSLLHVDVRMEPVFPASAAEVKDTHEPGVETIRVSNSRERIDLAVDRTIHLSIEMSLYAISCWYHKTRQVFVSYTYAVV